MSRETSITTIYQSCVYVCLFEIFFPAVVPAFSHVCACVCLFDFFFSSGTSVQSCLCVCLFENLQCLQNNQCNFLAFRVTTVVIGSCRDVWNLVETASKRFVIFYISVCACVCLFEIFPQQWYQCSVMSVSVSVCLNFFFQQWYWHSVMSVRVSVCLFEVFFQQWYWHSVMSVRVSVCLFIFYHVH